MKPTSLFIHQRGFTLMETVIAIGVLSVLLTGFMIVFMPAADGIKKAMSLQEADRLVTTLEHELVNLRPGDENRYQVDSVVIKTGFDKGFCALWKSTGTLSSTDAGDETKALLVYHYRGDPSVLRDSQDKTPQPVASVSGNAGEDYDLVPMIRRKDDPLLLEDMLAIQGSMYLVKCPQLVFKNNELILTTNRGNLVNPTDDSIANEPDLYNEAVLAFMAEFYPVPSKAVGFIDGPGFANFYKSATKPTFTRNLAIRR